MNFINQLLENFKKAKFVFLLKANLADMQVISKYNKGIKFLSRVIYIFSKDVWVVLLKDKKGITNVNIFQSILDSSKGKPNKIWVAQGCVFYNNFFKETVR